MPESTRKSAGTESDSAIKLLNEAITSLAASGADLVRLEKVWRYLEYVGKKLKRLSATCESYVKKIRGLERQRNELIYQLSEEKKRNGVRKVRRRADSA